MAKQFNSGVGWFTTGHLPPLNFPKDDVCCERCALYKKHDNRCYWTNEVIPRPKEHIGERCPIIEFDIKES